MPPGPRRATLWSLGLLALVLALLAVGGALRLDDGSGRGWMRTSWLFVDLAAAIGVLAATVDGFRIVWHAGEAELLVVVALLLLGASLFLVPEHPPPPTVRVGLRRGRVDHGVVRRGRAGRGPASADRTRCDAWPDRARAAPLASRDFPSRKVP